VTCGRKAVSITGRRRPRGTRVLPEEQNTRPFQEETHVKRSTLDRRLALLPVALLAVGLAAFLSACDRDDGKATGPSSGTTRQAAAKERKAHKAPAGTAASALKLAFVTNNASEFWKVAESGIRKYEKESGVKVDVKMPNTGTVQEQNQILETLLAQGYHGIAVSPIAPDDQTRILNKAAAQTNLICHDSDAPKSNRLLYVGTLNYDAGKALGEKIVELMPDGGKMAVFVGTFSAENARERMRGVEDATKGKNIEVAARKEDNKEQKKARSNVDDVLTSQGDVTMLVGLWSYNGPQIAAAIEGSGKKGQVKAAVFDDEVATLQAIEQGTLDATAVQRQAEFAYLAVKHLHELAARGDEALPAGDTIPTGVQIITKDNLAEFRREKESALQGATE
jgi:ribose transport system substrate-binding protein